MPRDPRTILWHGTRIPAHQALRTRMVALERDGASLEVDWREELVGDPETGAFMGGVVTSLLDHGSGLACVAGVNSGGRPGGTMDLRIDYLKPSTRGEPIRVDCTCYRVTRFVAFVSGVAYHPAKPGDIIARSACAFQVDRSGGEIVAGDDENVELRNAPAQPLTEPFPELVKRARATHDFSSIMRTVPYFAFLGLSVREQDGTLVTQLPGWPQHMGNVAMELLHGGVMGAQLEATAMLNLFAQGSSHVAKTISFTTEFLRPAPLGELNARAFVVRMGKRVANVRCEAWQDDPNRIVAAAHGNFLLT